MAALTADPNAPRGGGCHGVRGDDGVGGVVVEMMMVRLRWWICGEGDSSVERLVDEWRLVVLVLAVGGSEAGDDEGVKKSNTSDHGTTFIDVAATFGVPLTTVGDLQKLINDIDAGKHDELLSEFTNEDRYGNLESNSAVGSAKGQPNVIPTSYLVADPVLIGFFFFKFDSRAGLEAVLEGGPWLICKYLIILKKWSMDTRLLKEELTRIPIWVKLHDVPIQVFEEDGISLIATFIGKPVMLDSYTSSMCNDSWGRSSFARCLIKVNSEADLVDVVTIGIPSLSKDNFTKETIRVEYEWRPPRCDTCKNFGHVHDYCPKKV
ncbi:zinc knuckle CX2CX4HX4C containing protein, partial [Tanacetum coccineum]